MIELRWIVYENVGQKILEYRVLVPTVDASGCLCPSGEWYEWKEVPSFNGSEVYKKIVK